MTAHKHAEAMALYALDAFETETPWERWEYIQDGRCYRCGVNPGWEINNEYRRKPKTIRIGERDVPEPMRVAPAMGKTYYVVDYSDAEQYAYNYWNNDEYDNRMLQQGLCHSTTEAALAHAEALILVSGGTL